jgi:ketopantoate reductase
MATIIASESRSPAVGEIEAMVRLLEESKNRVRAEEAEYNTIREAILNKMVEGDFDSISTIYGMVTHARTHEWEYKDGEVTKAAKAVAAANRVLANLNKLFKAAQEIAQNNNKAKITTTVHTLRYYEPK